MKNDENVYGAGEEKTFGSPTSDAPISDAAIYDAPTSDAPIYDTPASDTLTSDSSTLGASVADKSTADFLEVKEDCCLREAEFCNRDAEVEKTASNPECDAPKKVQNGGQVSKVSKVGKVRKGGKVGRADIRRTVTLAMLVAAAMVLAYVESLIPAFFTVPGVKVGLANAVTLFALYVLDTRGAACISFLRVALAALLFGSAVSFIYSATGAVLSLLVMICVRRTGVFSTVGVSVAGGVAHNVGQVMAAAVTMESAGIFYYLAPLLVSGTLAGTFIGILTGILAEKGRGIINKILKK